MGAPSDRTTDLEAIRLAWDFASKEVDLQRQQMLQLFTVFVTAAVTAFAAAMLEKVSWSQAGAVIALMVIAASYTQVRLRRLRELLRHSYQQGGWPSKA